MKLLISYDTINDEIWRVKFDDLFSHDFTLLTMSEVVPAVGDGNDYVNKLNSSSQIDFDTMLIVMLGAQTYKLAKVDWDLKFALTPKGERPTPIIPLRLPSHPDFGKKAVNPGRLPQRLVDNLRSGFLKLHDWTESMDQLQKLVRTELKAVRNHAHLADNSRALMSKDLF
ncbi:MAG: hypothetical protein OEZ59_08365 [Deltaproteobacteria bacterium]|nr:hypothetical protein [Deltaproteobacteria bacterium]